MPIIIAAVPRTRTIPLLVAASVLVNIGMWMKRFTIVVPSLSVPLMPYEWGVYSPTVEEILITVASFAGFGLMITLFTKLFPIISVSEMEEGWEEAAEQPEPQPSPLGTLVPEPGGGN